MNGFQADRKIFPTLAEKNTSSQFQREIEEDEEQKWIKLQLTFLELGLYVFIFMIKKEKRADIKTSQCD